MRRGGESDSFNLAADVRADGSLIDIESSAFWDSSAAARTPVFDVKQDSVQSVGIGICRVFMQ